MTVCIVMDERVYVVLHTACDTILSTHVFLGAMSESSDTSGWQ